MRLFISTALVSLLLISSCAKKTNQNLKVSKLEEITISDGKPFLGEITIFDYRDQEHFFTYDSRANIKEFRNYSFSKVHGTTGDGPCEHGSVNDFSILGDSLYVLDRGQSKYIKYDLSNSSSNNCFEIVDENVGGLFGIQPFPEGTYFIRGALSSSMDPSMPVLYKYNKKDQVIEPAGVNINDLNIHLSGAPLRLSMATAKNDDSFLFYLPLTKKVFKYNAESESLESIGIDIYIAEDQRIHEIRDFQKLNTLLSEEVEVVFRMFAMKNRFALGYQRGKGEDKIRGLKIYDYEGNLLADHTFANRVVYVNEENLMTLELDVNKNENPYSLNVYEYTIK